MCIVLVYVDDLLISGDNEAYICTLKQDLHTEFTYSEGFGRDDMLFGPRSVHEWGGKYVKSKEYALDIVADTWLINYKEAKFPFPKGIKFSTDEGKIMQDDEQYRRLIGRLLYLNLSRLDLSYHMQQFSQFISCPRVPYWNVALHIVRYLKGTITQGLFYLANSPITMIGYCDADWGGLCF